REENQLVSQIVRELPGMRPQIMQMRMQGMELKSIAASLGIANRKCEYESQKAMWMLRDRLPKPDGKIPDRMLGSRCRLRQVDHTQRNAWGGISRLQVKS